MWMGTKTCAAGTLLLLLAIMPGISDAQKNPAELKQYRYGDDSRIHDGVPVGDVTTLELMDSKTFPGTRRRFYIYVPKQYDANQPASLMVFQDGHAYLNRDGDYRATVVMDNLIHQGQMPVTIGVFVDPGHVSDTLPEKPGWKPNPANRSVEYDTINGDYATFLIDEILPPILKQYNISDDPKQTIICGASSGGICAFNAAWHRPERFGNVISHIGSFTNIRHGDTLPGIVRKTEKKPIRVFLQDGSKDLDNEHGNWPLANQQMAMALAFKGYNYKFVFGEGGHTGNHGGSIFPDTIRWIWRDHPALAELPLSLRPGFQTNDWVGGKRVERFESQLVNKDAMPDAEVIMIGDSITQGWEGHGAATFKKYYAPRKTLNVGISGDRTENVLWRLDHGAIDGISPKLAVIMIGTNNTGHRKDPAEETAAGIERIVDEVHRRLPETKILLLAIFPRHPSPDGEPRKLNDRINEIISGLGERDYVTFLDIGDEFLDEDGTLPKAIMPDALHPRKAGYAIWAEAMEPTMRDLLGEDADK